MKKILIALALCTAIAGHAQNAKKDASGNYVAISVKGDSALYSTTGKTYTDSKGAIYPVLITAKGKLFVMKTSKTTGKEYRYYLKVN